MMAFGWLKFHVFRKRSAPAESVQPLMCEEIPGVSEDLGPEAPLLAEEVEQVSKDVRKLLKRSRRQQQLLEMIYEEHGKRLGGITQYMQGTLPCDRIFGFVEAFVLYAIHQGDGTPEFKNIWKKCESMLEGLGMEMIIDAKRPFDPVRHTACDTRWDGTVPEGLVLEVIRPGLMIQGEIYKTAVVVVNKQPKGIS